MAEQQLQSSAPLPSHSNAGSQMLGQPQQSLQQISGVQQQPANTKLEETRTAGLLDDGLSSPGQDKIAVERERQRQREQERRRREAVSSNSFENVANYSDYCEKLSKLKKKFELSSGYLIEI